MVFQEEFLNIVGFPGIFLFEWQLHVCEYVTFSIDIPEDQLVHDNVFPKEWPFGKHKEHNVKTILLHTLIP